MANPTEHPSCYVWQIRHDYLGLAEEAIAFPRLGAIKRGYSLLYAHILVQAVNDSVSAQKYQKIKFLPDGFLEQSSILILMRPASIPS